MYTPTKIERFNENVLSKYQIYNSVFITLPFDAIDNTGVLLPLFSDFCDKGFKNKKSPIQIFNEFSDKFLDNKSENEKIDLLFRFIQYVERQIVLFDAIEDAAFPIVNNMEGRGSLRDIKEKAEAKDKMVELKDFGGGEGHGLVEAHRHFSHDFAGFVVGCMGQLTYRSGCCGSQEGVLRRGRLQRWGGGRRERV